MTMFVGLSLSLSQIPTGPFPFSPNDDFRDLRLQKSLSRDTPYNDLVSGDRLRLPYFLPSLVHCKAQNDNAASLRYTMDSMVLRVGS
jgi:hypothetical protein